MADILLLYLLSGASDSSGLSGSSPLSIFAATDPGLIQYSLHRLINSCDPQEPWMTDPKGYPWLKTAARDDLVTAGNDFSDLCQGRIGGIDRSDIG